MPNLNLIFEALIRFFLLSFYIFDKDLDSRKSVMKNFCVVYVILGLVKSFEIIPIVFFL